MAIIKLFNSKKEGGDEEESDEAVEPELIVEDFEEGYEEEKFEEIFYEESMQTNQTTSQRLYRKIISFSVIRFFIGAIGFLVFLWTFFSLLMTALTLSASLLTLFQNEKFLAAFLKRWSNAKFGLVCTIGLIVALFSPSLGMSMIASYCMLNVEDPQSSFFLRFLESRLKEFGED